MSSESKVNGWLPVEVDAVGGMTNGSFDVEMSSSEIMSCINNSISLLEIVVVTGLYGAGWQPVDGDMAVVKSVAEFGELMGRCGLNPIMFTWDDCLTQLHARANIPV